MRRLIIVCVAGACLMATTSCGGQKIIEATRVETTEAPAVGPKATPEEVRGEVPALRPIVDALRLVPEELVPPEPPPDPEPVFY